MKLVRYFVFIIILSTSIYSQIFIAPDGNDANTGTIDVSSGTLQKAQKLLSESDADFIQLSGENGLVVMPAEEYSSYRSGSGDKEGETFTFEDSTSGFIDDGYMRANMEAGDGNIDNAENINIKLSYNIEFIKTGTHYIWAHVFFPSPNEDSFFFGINGLVVDQIAGSPRGEWHWHKGNIPFEIPEPGLYTLDIFGREPNSYIDHIIVTTDEAFNPETDDYSTGIKIAFVSLPGIKDENGNHPDSLFIEDLKAEGYTVNTVYSASLETASQGLLDTLNSANLVIIGRSGASIDFGGSHREAWNAIKTPLLSLHLWAARNNRLNWLPTETTTSYDTGGETIKAKIEIPNDDVFATTTISVDSTMDWVTTPYDFMATTDGGNGTVLARESISSNVLFVRWNPWVEFYNGAGTMPAGYRTLIGNGNDHANATSGDPFNFYNFSEDAKQVYLNEVARMVQLPQVPKEVGDLSIIFVAPDGNDDNPGTIDEPLATIQEAQKLANAGDTIYIRGGEYFPTEDDISQVVNGLFASVTYLDKSGTEGNLIKYWAYPGETPIFDFSAVKPVDKRVVGMYVIGEYIHIKGIEMTGIQVTITSHTESYCIYSRGSNNIFEQISMHHNVGTGLRHFSGGGNLFLNCDSYNNWDNVSEDKLGSNSDGFGCHSNSGTEVNIFKGCRAWFNSDDGFDIIRADQSVVFDSCWAFYNGYSTNFSSLGDGNGFKAGGYAYDTANDLPNPVPRNTIQFCIAVKNRANGFYSNHHLGGNDWYNNSAYQNLTNFNMANRESPASDNIWVNGYDHVIKNNLSYQTGFGSKHTAYIDTSQNVLINNSWDMELALTANDFASLDEDFLTAPRKTDGSLPDIDFMKPVTTSKIIDAGVDIGFEFMGNAPELGAIEVDTPVGVGEEISNISNRFYLAQNYPNPFNPTTNIIYEISQPGNVKLSIYNSIGEEIETLVNGEHNIGSYEIQFDGSNLTSGVYFYKLQADQKSIVKQMILLK